METGRQKTEYTKESTPPDLRLYIITLLYHRDNGKATEAICDFIKSKRKIYTTRHSEKEEMWIYDNGIYVPHAETFIKEICRELLGEKISSTLFNTVILKIQADSYISQEEFFKNEYPELLLVQNGILNVRTREIIPFDQKYKFFNKLPVFYVKDADCIKIKQFFKEILQDGQDVLVMQENFGSLLYKNYMHHKAMMYLGEGRNGKGLTIRLKESLLGKENCSNISLQELAENDFSMSFLQNKMANMVADMGKKALTDTSKFKTLTGQDLVTANRKFLTPVQFTNYAKMIFSCNELPITYDHTDGFFDRWIMIDFKLKFVSKDIYEKEKDEKPYFRLINPNLINELTTQEELSGLLNWALDGLDRLFNNDGFSVGTSTIDIKKKWLRTSSSIHAFLMDCVEQKWDSKLPKEELRMEYAKYCSRHRLVAVNDKIMKDLLVITYGCSETYLNISGERMHCWLGISLKEDVSSLSSSKVQGVQAVQPFSKHSSTQNYNISVKNPELPEHPEPSPQVNSMVIPEILKQNDITYEKQRKMPPVEEKATKNVNWVEHEDYSPLTVVEEVIDCNMDVTNPLILPQKNIKVEEYNPPNSLKTISVLETIDLKRDIKKDILQYLDSKKDNVNIEQLKIDLKIDDRVIESLKRDGIIYEVRSGFIQKL